MLVNPKIRGKAREAVLEAARGGEDLDEGHARYVRVAGYEVPDRDGDGKGEVIALVTTITEMTAAAAPLLAGHTTEGGSMKPGMPSSRRPCEAPGRCCGPRARTWSARRSTATCSLITPCRP